MRAADFLVLRDVHFSHDTSVTLIAGASFQLPPGWTGVVGPNGGGKSTLLRLACGELAPQQGCVQAPAPALLCAQRVDAPPPGLGDLLAGDDAEAWLWRDRLGVADDAVRRWRTLSPGERKRAQLALALWRAPALLAVDEPTNHLDAQARRLVIDALARHRGVGLVVSHDRELLDALCTRTVFVDPPELRLASGSYGEAAARARADREHALHERESARRERDRLAREAGRRRDEAARADRRRSKRGLAPRDHDARGRIDLARVSGKDGQAGRLQRQLDARVARASERVEATRVRKEYRLGIALAGERSQKRTLLHRDPGPLPLGAGRRLQLPELRVGAGDRIAITGPNGAGKSTLLRALLADARVATDALVVMPQEIEAGHGAAILREARDLPAAELGRVMTAVSALGSRPARLLATPEPSPGELRKLLLALGLARTPQLLVLDEPTNHLDLPSIECLERALAECEAALVLVSHDGALCAALTRREWRLVPAPDGTVHLEER